MKSIEFKKKTWHFSIANWCDGDVEYHYTDICSYSKLVLLKAVAMSIIAFVSFLLVYSLYNFVVMLVIWGIYGKGNPLDLIIGPSLACGFALWGIIIGLASIVCTVFICLEAKAFMEEKNITLPRFELPFTERPTSFIREAYHAFKGKYCVRITFK